MLLSVNSRLQLVRQVEAGILRQRVRSHRHFLRPPQKTRTRCSWVNFKHIWTQAFIFSISCHVGWLASNVIKLFFIKSSPPSAAYIFLGNFKNKILSFLLRSNYKWNVFKWKNVRFQTLLCHYEAFWNNLLGTDIIKILLVLTASILNIIF